MVHQSGVKSAAPATQDARFSNLHIVEHPLARHFLSVLREKNTEPARFRAIAKRLTLLLAIEASRGMQPAQHPVSGILEDSTGWVLDEQIIAVVILRAGLGMLDPIVELFPNVSVGYVGLERDERTAVASSYYAKLPPSCAGKSVLLLDPMLATGGSASQAIGLIKTHHPREIAMLAIVAAPEGVARLASEHVDVPIYTAALDRELDSRSYILPGLGDFGDRLYGT